MQSVVIGLAHGLSQLTDRSDEYVFLTYEGHDEWIRPYLDGPCEVMATPLPGERWGRARDFVKTRAPRLADWGRSVKRTAHRLRGGPPASVPRSDPAIDESDFDAVHFPFQGGFLTELPSIYHPHDLQHLHLPQFFTPEQRQHREIVYRSLCEDASMVAVASNWVREDIFASYQIPEDRVVVVPLAPPVDAYARASSEKLAAVRKRYGLPPRFILYPATTWPHKNHIRLLQALATLRANGLDVPLVCTGTQTEHFRSIRVSIRDLGLNDTVRFLGTVPAEELMALYEMATAVVVPTEFEAASFPIWEAFRAGVPVACSNVTSLPEQVGDAALLFDPRDISAMAAAIKEIWVDPNRREELVARGRKQVERYDWVKTARMFRAHYRRIAGRELNEEDLHLLSAVPSI